MGMKRIEEEKKRLEKRRRERQVVRREKKYTIINNYTLNIYIYYVERYLYL